MFYCTLDNIKHFEIVAKVEPLFPTLFTTGKSFLQKLYTLKSLVRLKQLFTEKYEHSILLHQQ